MAFLEAANKQTRYSACIYQLKALKQVVNEVDSSQRAKNKVGMIFLDV